MANLTVSSIYFILLHFIIKSSYAASVAIRASPPSSPASLSLTEPNAQFNFTIQPALVQSGHRKNLTMLPEVYEIPYAVRPTSLRIAWHFGELPRDEFTLLVLRGLNSLINTVIRKPAGDRALDGDRITWRSPHCFVRATSEERDSLSYGTLATAFRGVGELMNTWGAMPAEMLIMAGAVRVGRISVEVRWDAKDD